MIFRRIMIGISFYRNPGVNKAFKLYPQLFTTMMREVQFF